MAVHTHDDLLCRVFPSSIKGITLDWFYSLPSRSLQSFKEVNNTFNQHASLQEFKKNTNYLLTIKMK